MGIFAYQHTMLKIKFQNPNGFLLLFFAIFFLARRSNSGPLNCLTPIKKESELWRIPETHRSYYEQISPDDKFSIFSSIFRDHSDPTYGRKQISKSPGEMQIKNDGFLKLDAKVYLDHKTNVLVNHKTKSWVRYQIWLDSKAAESQNNKMDFFFAHGMNSYGGIFSRFAKSF
ncbi:expressed protein [Phakopsora pachyrhizi]|uniref:Expressed protein n=1 Tax=Phakopsora pachyrhizi TaxID=170000 RepID=A0AAV0BPW0_PHAPC|nr:expressed protein [Phakopsora pachyrhizi]